MKKIITYLLNNNFAFLCLLYFISFGLIIINDGLFWDDWCFYFNGNKSSIYNYNLSAGLPFNGLIINFILSFPFSIIVYRLLIYFTYLFAGYNFYRIIKTIKYLNDSDKFWLTSIFLLIPINFARIAFTNFQYALGYCLFFHAVKLLLDNKSNKFGLRLIVLLLFLISFNTNSLLLFYSLPICYFWYTQYYLVNRSYYFSIKLFVLKRFDLIIAPFIYWILKVKYFSSYGIFAEYNEIKFINILTSPFKAVGAFNNSIMNVFNFNEINYIVVIILSLFIFRFTKHRIENNNKYNTIFICLGLVSFYLAVAPYIFVGRGFDYGLEWGGRDQLLVPLSAAFIIYFSINKILFTLFNNNKNINVIMSFVIAIFININISNYLKFHLDWFKQLSMMNLIGQSEKIKNNTNILFNDKTEYLNGLNRKLRFYEFNGMFKFCFDEETRLGIPFSDYKIGYQSNYSKYKIYPGYNFSKYNNENDPSILVDIEPGIYKPTKRGTLKLIAFKLFYPNKFQNYLEKLIEFQYPDIKRF